MSDLIFYILLGFVKAAATSTTTDGFHQHCYTKTKSIGSNVQVNDQVIYHFYDLFYLLCEY